MSDPPNGSWFPLKIGNIAEIWRSAGVAGKISHVAMVLLIAFGVIGWSANGHDKVVIVGIAAGCFLGYLLVVLLFSWLNPTAAILEGQDYVKVRTYEMAAKGDAPSLPTSNVAPPLTITSTVLSNSDDPSSVVTSTPSVLIERGEEA